MGTRTTRSPGRHIGQGHQLHSIETVHGIVTLVRRATTATPGYQNNLAWSCRRRRCPASRTRVVFAATFGAGATGRNAARARSREPARSVTEEWPDSTPTRRATARVASYRTTVARGVERRIQRARPAPGKNRLTDTRPPVGVPPPRDHAAVFDLQCGFQGESPASSLPAGEGDEKPDYPSCVNDPHQPLSHWGRVTPRKIEKVAGFNRSTSRFRRVPREVSEHARGKGTLLDHSLGGGCCTAAAWATPNSTTTTTLPITSRRRRGRMRARAPRRLRAAGRPGQLHLTLLAKVGVRWTRLRQPGTGWMSYSHAVS